MFLVTKLFTRGMLFKTNSTRKKKSTKNKSSTKRRKGFVYLNKLRAKDMPLDCHFAGKQASVIFGNLADTRRNNKYNIFR
jgi:hypothetical protein